MATRSSAGRRLRHLAAAGVLSALALPAAAGAATGTITYIKDGNVFVGPADGSAAAQVTRDGSPSAPYLAAGQSAAGVIVAVRDGTAFRLAQSGQQVASPVPLGGATGGGSVSPDGRTLAYVDVHFCGIVPRACESTFFVSLESGRAVPGNGEQMTNPVWAGNAEVVGATACGIYRAAPGRTAFEQWLSGLSDLGLGPGCVVAPAATADGTRLAVAGQESLPDRRTLWLMTTAGLGGAITPRCRQEIPVPGPEPHPVWSPEGDAVAWEEADGIWAETVADLSGTDAGCQANGATARLVVPGGTRPAWSAAPFDPRPVAQPGPAPGGPGGPSPQPESQPQPPGGAPAARARLRVVSAPRLRRALRRGVTLGVTCPERCSATATARIDRRTARRHRLGRRPTVVARGTARSAAAGRPAQLRLRFTGRARRRLARARRVVLDVSVVVRSASGRETQRRKVTLRR
jgi:hypothetical protein